MEEMKQQLLLNSDFAKVGPVASCGAMVRGPSKKHGCSLFCQNVYNAP